MGDALVTVRVICDFDGTISERDMIVSIMRHFAPEASESIIQAVRAGERSVKDGVEAMFALIPSNQYGAVAAYAQAATAVRRGFPQFIHTCEQLGWKVAIVSGGFDFFVEPVIHNLSTASVDIYCNRIDASGSHLRVRWSKPCDEACDGGCGLCKPRVIREIAQPGDRVIAIGDGVTDVKAAKMADFVFARSDLLRLARELGLPHLPFETFDDITAAILDKGSELYAHLS